MRNLLSWRGGVKEKKGLKMGEAGVMGYGDGMGIEMREARWGGLGLVPLQEDVTIF